MKRKVVKEAEEVTAAENVSDDRFYGTENKCVSRGFITRQKYREMKFISLAFEEITNGNGFGDSDGYWSLQEAIQDFLKLGFAVYEFDTAKELFEWLLEKE